MALEQHGVRRTHSLTVAAALVYVVVALGLAEAAPVATRADAVARAVALTGLPESAVVAAEYRETTDPSVPVFAEQAFRVWEVAFEGVTVAVPQADGTEKVNTAVNSFRVWVDSETGSLVKVSSPMPAEGAMTLKVGAPERGLLSGNHISLRMDPSVPQQSFMAALAAADREHPGAVAQAKQVTAYYGLLTDNRGLQARAVDVPAWFVYLGGTSQPFSSGGPPGRTAPPPVATEVLTVVDAVSGKPYFSALAGR